MTSRQELRHRVEAKRKELEAKLETLKADAIGTTNNAKQSVQQKLEELNGYLREGWEKVSEETASKLNRWLN